MRMKRAKTGEMLRTVTLLPCGVPRLPDGVSFCPPGKLWVEQGKESPQGKDSLLLLRAGGHLL